MILLTKKQKRVLDFINKYRSENGISPTIDEIRKGLKLKANSTIYEHVKTLLNKGYLLKNNNMSRNFTITKVEKIKATKEYIDESEIEKLQERQEEIFTKFSREQKKLVFEAIDIEYKLTKFEEGYKLEDID